MSTPKDKMEYGENPWITTGQDFMGSGMQTEEPQKTASRQHHLPADLVHLEIQVIPAAQEDPEEEEESVRQC